VSSVLEAREAVAGASAGGGARAIDRHDAGLHASLEARKDAEGDDEAAADRAGVVLAGQVEARLDLPGTGIQHAGVLRVERAHRIDERR